MSAFVLVVSLGDRSGLQHVWGPFASEEQAQEAWTELNDIGIVGLGEVHPLRRQVPTAARYPDTKERP